MFGHITVFCQQRPRANQVCPAACQRQNTLRGARELKCFPWCLHRCNTERRRPVFSPFLKSPTSGAWGECVQFSDECCQLHNRAAGSSQRCSTSIHFKRSSLSKRSASVRTGYGLECVHIASVSALGHYTRAKACKLDLCKNNERGGSTCLYIPPAQGAITGSVPLLKGSVPESAILLA